MSITLDGLHIPDFANTEEAIAWGRDQRPQDRDLVWQIYKAFERIALNTTSLQKKSAYATQAQLLREAHSAIPLTSDLRPLTSDL